MLLYMKEATNYEVDINSSKGKCTTANNIRAVKIKYFKSSALNEQILF